VRLLRLRMLRYFPRRPSCPYTSQNCDVIPLHQSPVHLLQLKSCLPLCAVDIITTQTQTKPCCMYEVGERRDDHLPWCLLPSGLCARRVCAPEFDTSRTAQLTLQQHADQQRFYKSTAMARTISHTQALVPINTHQHRLACWQASVEDGVFARAFFIYGPNSWQSRLETKVLLHSHPRVSAHAKISGHLADSKFFSSFEDGSMKFTPVGLTVQSRARSMHANDLVRRP